MKKIVTTFAIFFLFVNCKKQMEEETIIPKQIECDNDIDNFIVKSKSEKKLETIFLDYWLKMSKNEYETYSQNYIKKDILKSHNDTLWIHLPDKTASQRKQFLELHPKFENDSLVELTLFSPLENQDYNHYSTLISKYGKANIDLNCQFLHRTIWEFSNAIIEYTESDTEKRSQFISYQDIKYAKKKAKENLDYEQKEEQTRIFNEKKLKESIAKRDGIINNAL